MYKTTKRLITKCKHSHYALNSYTQVMHSISALMYSTQGQAKLKKNVTWRYAPQMNCRQGQADMQTAQCQAEVTKAKSKAAQTEYMQALCTMESKQQATVAYA